MASQRTIECLIAAGGTAGHVLPSLAVADALRRRGASVRFAGAQRAEAELVPAAGYPLESVQGGGPAAATEPRSRPRARRPTPPRFPACLKILRRVRPGRRPRRRRLRVRPDRRRGAACCASRSRSPRPTRTSGLRTAWAAPFASRVFLSFPIEGRDGDKYRSSGGRSPRSRRRPIPAEARARFGLPAEGPVVLIFGGSMGARALNEAAVEAFAADGPAVLHFCGEHVSRSCARGSRPRPDYVLARLHGRLRSRAGRRDAGGRARGRLRAGRSPRPASPRCSSPIPSRPADHQTKNARFFEQAGGAIVVPEERLELRAQVTELLAEPARLDAMGAGDARARAAGRGRRDRRGGARALHRLRAASSGSPGSAEPGLSGVRARGTRLGRRGGRLGPQGDAVPRSRARGRDRRDRLGRPAAGPRRV